MLFDLGYFIRTFHLIGESLAANPENSACVELKTLLVGQLRTMGMVIAGGILVLAALLQVACSCKGNGNGRKKEDISRDSENMVG